MAGENHRASFIVIDELNKRDGEMALRIEAQKYMDLVRNKAVDVLSLLIQAPNFAHMFLVHSLDDLSAFVFTHYSERTIVVDMLARCPREQMVNFDTYKFTTHPEFEKKISLYTRSAEKPNSNLAKCRSWDMGLVLILKVEALDGVAMQQPAMRLLFRENLIFKHLWDSFLQENMELDEMTGIPMVFKYDEVPNAVYTYDSAEPSVYDIYGQIVPWKGESRSTLSYLCMEQLGPNLNYLTEIMSFSPNRKCLFDVGSALKIFDQILCRCLQMHRFGVVHNAVEPYNLYFGRGITFNVLYISNFKVATVFNPKDGFNFRRSKVESKLFGHPRFASHFRMKGDPPHPVHDLESAFYTLVVLLTNNLPWDACLSLGSIKRSASLQSVVEITASNNFGSQAANSIEQKSKIQKLRDMKSNFWRSKNGFARTLADLQYKVAATDLPRVALTLEIMKELYSKIRDLLLTLGSELTTNTYLSKLFLQHTPEYQTYTELRRVALMVFHFEALSAFINTSTYQKKIESLIHDDIGNSRLAWNLANWCFNAVEVGSVQHGPSDNFGKSILYCE